MGRATRSLAPTSPVELNEATKYALSEPGGYDFTPLAIESCGRQCSAAHTLLNPLGRQASDSGRVTKGARVEGALRRLSVALCKGNDFLFRANLHDLLGCCQVSHKGRRGTPHH